MFGEPLSERVALVPEAEHPMPATRGDQHGGASRVGSVRKERGQGRLMDIGDVVFTFTSVNLLRFVGMRLGTRSTVRPQGNCGGKIVGLSDQWRETESEAQAETGLKKGNG